MYEGLFVDKAKKLFPVMFEGRTPDECWIWNGRITWSGDSLNLGSGRPQDYNALGPLETLLQPTNSDPTAWECPHET